MTDLKPEDLVKLREIAEKATPGPWQIVSDFPTRAIKSAGRSSVVQTPNQNAWNHYGPANNWDGVQGENNAEYIAAFSPDVALSLLADRERMAKALGEITKEFGALQKVGAGDGQTFITNDTLAATTMRQIARQALGVSQ